MVVLFQSNNYFLDRRAMNGFDPSQLLLRKIEDASFTIMPKTGSGTPSLVEANIVQPPRLSTPHRVFENIEAANLGSTVVPIKRTRRIYPASSDEVVLTSERTSAGK